MQLFFSITNLKQKLFVLSRMGAEMCLSSRNGFSLFEMMIAGSVAGVLMLGSASILQMLSSTNSKIENFRGLSNLRAQLEFHFNDPKAVANTISVNATMACLGNLNEDCINGPDGRPFEIFDSSQNLSDAKKVPAFDQAPNMGFTSDGTSCSDFGTAGSKCILRYETKWVALCGNDTSRCRAPSYRLIGNLITSDPSAKINLNLYNVEVVRSASGEQAEQTCRAFGGTFSDNSCAVLLSENCPSGELFIGVGSNNKKSCRGISLRTCPLGTVIKSISSSGDVVCQPGCYLLNVTCTFNMWTGVSDCPTDVRWVSGEGIRGDNPNLVATSWTRPPPPAPPPPPPPPPPAPPPAPDPVPPSGDSGGSDAGGGGGSDAGGAGF